MAIGSKPTLDDLAWPVPNGSEEVAAVDRLEAQRLNLQGMRLGQSGQLAAAVAVLERATGLDPWLWRAHNNLGIALAQLRRFDEASVSFRRATTLEPSAAQAHNNLANVLAEQGIYEEAISHFERALRLDPDYPDAGFNLAKALYRAGRFDAAAERLRQVLRFEPGLAKAHRHLGMTLAARQNYGEAVVSLRRAVELDPDDAENHFQLGSALRDARRYPEAIVAFERSLRLRPAHLEALNSLATCLTQEGRPERAIDCFRRATELYGPSPTIDCNWGIALSAWGEYEQALAVYRRALDAKPDHTAVHNNVGTALVGLRRYREAIACYDRALALGPHYADAHRNRALIHLLLGDFERGWPEFEWRWECGDFDKRRFSQPAWDGGPLEGKTILLHAEQGLGDTLQFIRYAARVKDRGATVVVRVPQQLARLLGRSPGIDRLVSGERFDDFDVHLPLMSLPRIFGTTAETIPSQVPYLFADEELVERWRKELWPLRAGRTGAGGGPAKARASNLLVGIAWQGNPRYPADRLRSIPLKHFAPLASLPGIRLINLQKGFGTEQLLDLAGLFSVSEPVSDVDRTRGRFMDTAAMMMNLDLVVTSDTAVAHLAGGLGVPVWVAIPYAPDWRWLLEREDSPWYPTMRLFRQTAPGDWEGVFRRIRRELRRFSPRSRTDSDDSSKPKRSPPAPEDRGESPAVPTTGQAHSTPVHVPPSALVEHGVRLADAGRLRQAFFAFKCVVWLDPCSVDGHYNLGTVLHRLGRFAEAAASFRRCLRVAPRYAEARTNLAVALAELGQAEQAEKELRIAIRRLPRNVEAHYSLGNVLASQGRWEEALDRFRYVMELGPDFAQGHYGAANVYHQQARFDRALAAYDRALQLQPHFKEARRLRAATRLLTGDVERGWPDYAPLSPGQFGSDEPDRTSQEPGSESNRRWHLTAGHDLAENLILLRYAELAKRNGASISVVCRAEQQAIVGGCRGVDSTRARGGEPPAADLYASLAALPSLLGSPAVGQTSRTPFLSLDPALVEAWRNLLDPLGGLKIGVYWQCDARDGNVPEAWIDALAQVPQVRLVDLGALADGPLALDANAGSQPKKRRSSGQAPGPTNLPRVSRGGRQHGTPAGLSGGVEGRGAKGLTTTMSGAVIPQVETFADLAAVIANLDLVIATDGVCAHLAGALDVPLYVPLPVVPKWYWLLHREDSPWYPCARLFRQSRRGEWDDVCQRIRQAIADLLAGDPTAESTRYDNADRLCAKGLASLERGEVHESLAWFERAVEAAPAYAAAHNNLGSALARLGRHDEAASAYRMALKRRPNYPEALVNLGIALANLGQHDEAIRSFRLAVRQRPEWARGHFYLGNGLVALGQWHAALASYREGHRLAPHDEDLRLNLGVALRQTGRLEEAATVLEGLLSQQPDHVDALNNLAVAYCRGQQYWKALERLQQVLRLSPGFAAAHNNLGIVLAHLERYGDAIAAYQRALSISPDYAEAYNNLGIALTREGRFSEALGSFERALRLRPDYPQALNNRGIALRELGRVDEALAGYERALSGDPDYTDAHLNRAFVLLLRGDWQRGWQEYEWRFKHRPSAEKRFAQPAWQGEPLDGRTLLICCEQGLGDALQFIRFTALAKQRGARVVVRCPKRMINLLSRASHIDLLVGEEDKLPSFDCHAPLLSLPRILGTTLETLPNEVPYLSADPELVEHWRARVREDRGAVRGPAGAGYDGDELLVGINWQGNAHYEGDRHRSFPMTCFAPLASVAGVRLLSLQKGVGQEQLARLHARPGGIGRHRDLEIAVQPPGVASRRDEIQGFTIADLGPDVDESRGAFMDTAAVMMHLDLVITSDTSVAHLAGALGRPVWVALPFSADWRWLLRRDDSPWYPTMRLYRQPARGDWEAVFQRIKDDLTELVTAQIGNDLAE